MAAFIPSRRDPEVNAIALEKVREDKQREATDGFDGTWVAHPDLVPDRAGGVRRACSATRPNQVERKREEVDVTAAELLDVAATPGDVTEAACGERLGRHPVHRGVARGIGRGGDQQPDGGRRDGRDLALAGLAVGAPRPDRVASASSRSRPTRWRASAPDYETAREVFDEVALRTSSSSSSR